MGRMADRNCNKVEFIGGVMVRKAPTEKQTTTLLVKASDECKRSVAAVQEACAVIYSVETRLLSKSSNLATKKHLKLAIIINVAVTALIVLVASYVKE